MPDGKYGRVLTTKDLPELLVAAMEITLERGTRANLTSEELAELALQRLDSVEATTIPASEPLFLLRAQDEITAETVRDYLGTARDAGASPEHLEGVRAQLELIEAWRADHPDRIKVGD